jgi:hypothetical protein
MGLAIFPIVTVFTLLFFMLSAFTNPGYIIGNE